MAEASLTQLHDLALPAPVAAWPPAPFASLLLALLGIALLLLAIRTWRRWCAEAYRRQALADLCQLEEACRAAPQRLAELPRLLKHSALQAWPRERVAALSGDAWLAFLRQHGPTTELPASLGELACWPPERLAALPPGERERLLRAAAHWLRHHVRA